MNDREAFRREVRAWLEKNCPAEKRGPMSKEDHYWGGRRAQFKNHAQRIWFERMVERGWTAPEWPTEYGGGGFDPAEAAILEEELGRIAAHWPLSSIGIWMLGPALLRFGTAEQKRKHLPAIVRGEIRWCQGYSEPNAGSDLASLETRAELIGDEFIVNGQKIWTSNGHLADWIFCLVRTDPSKPRHGGISFLLFDMSTPGITVKPLHLLSGADHFAQEFFDDVRVPKENLVGELNRGWDVAKYLLRFERSHIGGISHMGEATTLMQFALRHIGAERLREEPHLRARIVDLEMELEGLAALMERTRDEVAAGATPGARSSMMKYLVTELNVKKHEVMLSILGTTGLEHGATRMRTAGDWLDGLANRCGGGTSEIQLNIVAKRVLNLPGG